MMKKILSLAMAAVLALSLVACGGADNGAAGTKTTTLKLSFNQSEAHPQFLALTELSKKFYEATEGRYTIEISPNELLGNQKDSFESVQTGAIQMAMVANSLVENVNGDFSVIGMPFVYDSVEHQEKVFTSGVLDELFATTEANGFTVLTAFTAGGRCVYTDKPVKTPADLAGYKIRVMESPTMMAMMEAMGGVGTPMAQGEVYTAIQQGVINGGENNEITYNDLKHYEVAPYFSYTRHLMIPDLLIINTDTLKGMSEEDQATLKTLVKETTAREFELWNENVAPARENAEANGATFVEVDITPFQKACESLQKEIAGKSETATKLYNAVRELAA